MEWFKTVPFSDVVLWDVKRYSFEKIKSQYPIVKLGMHIQEESHKVKLSDYPDEEFGILGVNNKIGIFDAYKEKGANINQSYKKMEKGWLAYNPYRVNVGSIGLRTEEHENEYISPAYVVFSCKETLLPDFLFKLFKTERFNKVINASTTGSVRQNLTIDILKSLDIPLPSLDDQRYFIRKFKETEQEVRKLELAVSKIQTTKIEWLENFLGVAKIKDKKEKQLFSTIRFKSISRWAASFINNDKTYDLGNTNFPVVNLGSILLGFEGGKTPSKSNKSYWGGTICWTSPKDFNGTLIEDSEDKITEKAVADGAKVYPEGTLLGVFRSGILRHSFPIAKTTIKTAINQDLKALIINPERIRSNYLLLYLNSFQKLVLELSSKIGVTVESINSDEFLNLPLILPDLKTQDKIIEEIKEFDQKTLTASEKANKMLENASSEFQNKLFSE